MKHMIKGAVVIALVAAVTSGISGGEMKSVHQFVVTSIDGRKVPLESFKGKVMLVVNVASKCGFTPQYAGLQTLYEKYRERGFVILGFPANNFMGQEPGTNMEIKSFCSLNYGVTFPMFAKISVKGQDIHPLYRFLTEKQTNPRFSGKITWNFNKFLLDGNGRVIHRFGSRAKPLSEEVITAIEAALTNN